MCVCERVRACVSACVLRACVRACVSEFEHVGACVGALECVCVCVCVCERERERERGREREYVCVCVERILLESFVAMIVNARKIPPPPPPSPPCLTSADGLVQ